MKCECGSNTFEKRTQVRTPEPRLKSMNTAAKVHSIMFSERFAAAVRDGSKRQTIRPPRRRLLSPGDMVVLKRWTAMPYRSRQEILGLGTVLDVRPIEIHPGVIYLDGTLLTATEAESFSRADGFDSLAEFVEWFRRTHPGTVESPTGFRGIVIRWELNKPSK